MVSRYRPQTPILAITTNKSVYHELGMSWGVEPAMSLVFDSSEELYNNARKTAIKLGYAGVGDTIVVTAGIVKQLDGTNLMRIEKLM